MFSSISRLIGGFQGQRQAQVFDGVVSGRTEGRREQPPTDRFNRVVPNSTEGMQQPARPWIPGLVRPTRVQQDRQFNLPPEKIIENCEKAFRKLCDEGHRDKYTLEAPSDIKKEVDAFKIFLNRLLYSENLKIDILNKDQYKHQFIQLYELYKSESDHNLFNIILKNYTIQLNLDGINFQLLRDNYIDKLNLPDEILVLQDKISGDVMVMKNALDILLPNNHEVKRACDITVTGPPSI